MNTKKFNEFWDLVNKATCPKDFFGEIASGDKVAIAKTLKEKWTYFEKVSKNPKDGSEKYQKNRLLGKLTVLSTWADESLRDGTYDQKNTYRVKLKISIKKHQRKKFFFIENTSVLSVYFESLSAVHFEGYDRRDKITLTRNNFLLHEGSVTYYGTHGASEYFIDFLEPEFVPEIISDQLQEGDVIEIETLKYSSPDDFAKNIIGFYGVSKSLDKALSKNNGSLTGDQFMETISEIKVKYKKDISKQKVFILKGG